MNEKKKPEKIKKGYVYWITGLSGSGKTTLANHLSNLFKNSNIHTITLDGDLLRNIIGGGYTRDERLEQARKYAKFCKLFSEQGINVVAAFGALFNEIHLWNRKNIKNYIEVFLDVPSEELLKRNKKKLYSNFYKGKTRNIVGLDIKAEFPKKPDIILNNYGSKTIQDCINDIKVFHKNLEKKKNE